MPSEHAKVIPLRLRGGGPDEVATRSDDELMELAAMGVAPAFPELVRRYERAVRVYCAKWCGSTAGACGLSSAATRVGQQLRQWLSRADRAILRVMSRHPPARVLAEALRLPAQDRLAIASELIDSVEECSDAEWDAAWLAELDRRAQDAGANPDKLEDWASVRIRLLNELRSR